MAYSLAPLTSGELKKRLSDRLSSPAMPPGTLSLPGFHGLIVAVVTAPTKIYSSQWLPLLLGTEDFGPLVPKDEVKGFVADICDYFDQVVNEVKAGDWQFPNDYLPDDINDPRFTSLKDWSNGFNRGFLDISGVWEGYINNLNSDDELEKDMIINFIGSSTLLSSWAGGQLNDHHFLLEEKDDQQLVEEILEDWQFSYKSFLEVTDEIYKLSEERGQNVPQYLGKIGRNKPCPCGSGQKYKKCCLN